MAAVSVAPLLQSRAAVEFERPASMSAEVARETPCYPKFYTLVLIDGDGRHHPGWPT